MRNVHYVFTDNVLSVLLSLGKDVCLTHLLKKGAKNFSDKEKFFISLNEKKLKAAHNQSVCSNRTIRYHVYKCVEFYFLRKNDIKPNANKIIVAGSGTTVEGLKSKINDSSTPTPIIMLESFMLTH